MKDITDREFALLRDYIKINFGINLGDEKKSLIYSRLRTTLLELGFDDFTQYYDYLVGDKTQQAVVRFIDKVTTNHTFFMREVDHFDYFRETVLPYIEDAHRQEKDLRLWCAACSSGEESNTLQMIVQDYFKGRPDRWNTQILATDISTQVLDKAVMSVYLDESLVSLPERWRKDYFAKYDATHSAVKDEIKSQIVYRKFNLMETKLPFKRKFQVIFCRNVMIYFDNKTRDDLVKRFYDATEQGGYLFIGHSESLNHTATQYKYIMPAVYRKI
ncbi:MAG: protein-glutamate O-methyltransferase CheR [Defluviitaleaceae bacterium]|nr:protein-glutamate O-methyltransferase CheR [Defluviitaleaceae bacterium]